mmetsp:Transcript_21127/g.25117  ORF Transcript_21127/g.25117 Transcript_21127/m.25117 type:complete len:100 (-) Transcript_21127:152-451(-)
MVTAGPEADVRNMTPQMYKPKQINAIKRCTVLSILSNPVKSTDMPDKAVTVAPIAIPKVVLLHVLMSSSAQISLLSVAEDPQSVALTAKRRTQIVRSGL